MTISADKVAPLAVVLAFVGYCIWPSVPALLSDPPRSKPPEKIEEISAAMFSPKMPPAPTRNPWGGMDAATLAASKNAEEEKSSELADKLAESLADAAPEQPTMQPGDLLKELTLDATCIGGEQRLTVINNQMYALHQMLSEPNPTTPPCKIIDVRPYEVLLECQGKTLALRYSTVSTPEDEEDAEPQEAVKEPAGKKTGSIKKSSGAKSSTKKSKAGM